MPAEILAVERRIVNGNVFGVPKSVFRVDFGIANLHVAAILERIITLLPVVGDADMLAVHEEVIGPVDAHVFQRHVAAVPQGLLGIGQLNVFEFDAVHFAKHLRRVDVRVRHPQAARVPQGSPCPFGEKAVAHDEPVVVPKRIFALETAPDRLDVAALFQRRFAGVDDDTLQSQVARPEKRTLAAVFLI